MTATLPKSDKLPLWRLITGFAVFACLIAVGVLACQVYLDNYRLDRYMRSLAASADSTTLSDAVLSSRIVDRARQLELPVRASDVTITREGNRPHIRIARYGVQTDLIRMDLHLPEANSH